MLRIHELKLKPGEALELLPRRIGKKLGVRNLQITSWNVVRESIDARDKKEIRMVYTVDFEVEGILEESLLARRGKVKLELAPNLNYHLITDQMTEQEQRMRKRLAHRPVVVGFGPCGIFAGLLLAQMGYRPVILERGKEMEARVADVERFWREGTLLEESNVQFGEGGAGTFSDGKLTTQIRDPRVRKVLEELAEAGGGEEILYQQKPHIGTDVLRDVVVQIRKKICALGGEIRFQSRVSQLELEEEAGERRLTGLRIGEAGERLETSVAVLALGHSSRDTFRMLHQQEIAMEQKPFSIGVRIEHPQSMVDRAQFGPDCETLGLPAADYKLSWRCENGRGVYTFCMCPGGFVVGAASQAGGVVTNGMSDRDRGEKNANSALLVDVRTSDFGSEDPLAGIAFQERYERKAFELGGGNYCAPVQRLGKFMGMADLDEADYEDTPEPTYRPGIAAADLTQCLPEFAVEAMREAIPKLGRKLRGFDRPDALMTGVETRSSSPVRLLRSDELESVSVEGLFPGGEGAGYAGGIVSAAVDGIRIAESIAKKYQLG